MEKIEKEIDTFAKQATNLLRFMYTATEDQLYDIKNPKIGDICITPVIEKNDDDEAIIVGYKEFAWSGTEWLYIGTITTD